MQYSASGAELEKESLTHFSVSSLSRQRERRQTTIPDRTAILGSELSHFPLALRRAKRYPQSMKRGFLPGQIVCHSMHCGLLILVLLAATGGVQLVAQDNQKNEAKQELERIKVESKNLCIEYDSELRTAKTNEERELLKKRIPPFKNYVVRCLRMVDRWPDAPETVDALLWLHETSRYRNDYYLLDDPTVRPRIVALLNKHFLATHSLDDIDRRLKAHWCPNEFGFHAYVLKRIQKEGDNPKVVPLLIWIETTADNRSSVTEPETQQATKLLQKFINTREIGAWCDRMYRSAKDGDVAFLKQILRDNPHDEVKAKACLALGRQLLYPSDTEAEGVAYLQRVLNDFKQVEGKTKAQARRELNTYRSLISIGKVAPEIVGVDTFDKPLKLSDYRGKVVLLDFWGFW